MAYNPATDFLGLWRVTGGTASKEMMPGLDFVISALARAGIITVTVSATAPVANQSTTAWLQADVPSWSGEGAFWLWDKVTTAYLPATPKLFYQFLEACGEASGVSWWTGTGEPSNLIGQNGDFYVRTDEPGGTYGPKAAGDWPDDAVPGTENIVSSAALDNTFGGTPGFMLFRGATEWEGLPIGADNQILTAAAGVPTWDDLNALLDVLFGTAQGALLYRASGGWASLAPGIVNQVLATGGPGADPSWQNRTAEFGSGTRMVFQQTSAPTGWTKDVTINDYALRVTSGTANVVTGSPFSTVFAQTSVGNTTLTGTQMPSHNHPLVNGPAIFDQTSPGILGPGGGFGGQANLISIGNTGGGGSHNHSINLTVSYADVIIAAKD